MKSRLVILDANVIIKAFSGNFWKTLITQYDVYITSIVLHAEVYYYMDKNGQKISIDLTAGINSGKIIELTATPNEIATLVNKVNPNFMDRIDDGEQEALALLLTGRFEDFRYCTGDTRAIKALASLNLGPLGISLEEVLDAIGQKGKLPDPSYSKVAFDKKKAEGIQEQTMFLKKKP
ncbi:type II toxin-antitoxin system VapC family toxin [Bdellovibrionota bacterium FG-2]